MVDFKLTSGDVGENHRMQLAGYAVLVESALGLAVDLAFLFRIPDDKVFPVPITPGMKGRIAVIVESIRRMREREEFPAATEIRKRCAECEYAKQLERRTVASVANAPPPTRQRGDG